MKRALLVLCVLCVAWQTPPAAKPDLSSPEATVRSFVAAFNQGDINKAIPCVYGAKRTPQTDKLAQEAQQNLKKHSVKMTINELHIETSGDTAIAKIRVTQSAQPPAKEQVWEDNSIQLRSENGEWRIVPGDRTVMQQGRGYVTILATMLVLPPRAETNSCLSNIKQVSLAALMFCVDHNEKFAFKAVTYKKSIMPYVKSERVFHCPEDKSDAVSYAFNRNLEGITSYKVKRPTETVMIYEGKSQQLEFRHNGGANVGFVDGHCKLISKEQAKTLRWKP